MTGGKYELISIHTQLHCLYTLSQDIWLVGKGFNQRPLLNLCPKLASTKY